MKLSPFLLAAVVLLGSRSADAATLYWDINGTTPGAGGATPTGNWNTSTSNWNTASDGGGSGTVGNWVNGSDLVFSAGTDATGSFTVTPNSTVTQVNSLTYNNGSNSAVLTIAAGATILNTTGLITVAGSAGTRFAFNANIAGTNGLTKAGVGILQFNSTTPTYTGDTFITEGTIRIAAAGRIPVATKVSVSSGASFDLRADTTIAGLSGAGSVFEGASSSAATLILSAVSGSNNFSGVFSAPATTGTLHLTKGGASTQILSGAEANVNKGNTTVSGGILALAKTSGVNAIAGGVVTVSAGGTLRLDASDQIANTATLTLAGGTFDLNGTAGESFGTALSLSGNSTINFGAGLNSLSFAGSAAQNWGTYTITINGFTQGVDLLRFGTSAAGLTSEQLALFRFANYGNATASINEFGYLTPIPEPGKLALVFGVPFVFLMRRFGRLSVKA